MGGQKDDCSGTLSNSGGAKFAQLVISAASDLLTPNLSLDTNILCIYVIYYCCCCYVFVVIAAADRDNTH